MDWLEENLKNTEYKKLKSGKQKKYEKVAEIIKKRIKKTEIIAEIGCGPAHLKNFNIPIKYYDKFPCDQSIDYYDMNDKDSKLPNADVFVFMGVLEYSDNLERYLRKFNNGQKLIIYYTCTKYPNRILNLFFKKWLMKSQFKNILTKGEFVKVCKIAGLKLNKIEKITNNKFIVPHESYIFQLENESTKETF